MLTSTRADIRSATRDFTQPVHFRQFLSPSEVAQLKEQIKGSISRFISLQQPERGLKIYLDRVLDNGRKGTFMQQRPEADELLDTWALRCFRENSFGFILNNLELYNNRLTDVFSGIFHPTLQQTGMPLGGMAMLCLIGNYGFTPFGIHRDNKGDEGLLFHLGPGRKTYYTWNTDTFLRLSGGREVVHEVVDFLTYAQAHVLEPGDLMFTPSAVFHVADTREFSTSLVVDFINPSMDRLARELAVELPALLLDRSTEFCEPVHALDGALDMAERIDYRPALREALRHRTLRLRSHGGFYHPSALLRDLPATGPMAAVPWFPVLYDAQGVEGWVYARGHRFRVTHHPALEHTFEVMNSGRPVDLDWLKDQLNGWETQELLQLWVFLMQSGGIS